MSIDDTLKGEGFALYSFINEARMLEGMMSFLFDIVRGYFTDYRILPADEAFKGATYIPVEKAHVIYAKYSSKYLEEHQDKVRVVMAECSHIETGIDDFVRIG